MSEIRVLDLPDSLTISDNDYFLLEQNDGTKKAKGLIINKKIRETNAQLLEISKEIKTARGGKETLEMKLIDIENRAAENIAKQYLECSTDNGHMKVENCFNGKTKDMVVKGRTLQNLFSVARFSGNSEQIWFSNDINNNALYTAGKYQLINNSGKKLYFGVYNIDTNAYKRVIQLSSSSIVDLDNNEYIATVQGKAADSWVNNDNDKNLIKNQCIIIKTDKLIQTPTDYFEGIKSLGEEDGNRISILSTGKNLFDYSDYLNWETGGAYKYKILKLKPNTIYSLSKNINFGYVNISDTTTPIGSGENTKWICHPYHEDNNFTSNSTGVAYINYSGDVSLSMPTIQLEEGTVATPYEPYQSDKKDILIPVSGGAKGFKNVDDESYGNGDYLQNISTRKTLMDFNFDVVEIDAGFTGIVLNPKVKDKHPNGSYINNSLIQVPNSSTLNSIYQNPSNWVVVKPKGYTVEQFKTDYPNFELYHQLKDPILHKAETTQNNNFATFKDITHVSCLNKISPSSMSAKFPIDTAATFSRLNRENKNLEKENIELNTKVINQAIYFDEQTVDLATFDFETDFRIMEIEFALDIPINLNLKGMKNMAVRTPYDMAKIVILGGNYDRADMEYKLSVYVKRGRMTQEEHDELIALMDAQEIVQK